MPPCYTFNKMCVPDSGMTPCQGVPGTSCPTAGWFWIAMAIVGVLVVVRK